MIIDCPYLAKNIQGKNQEFHVHLDFRRWIAPPDILNQATGRDSWQMVLRWAENMKNGGNEIRIRIFGGNMKNGWNEIQIRIFPPTIIAVVVVAARCQVFRCLTAINYIIHPSRFLPHCFQLHHTSSCFSSSTINYISLYCNQLHHTYIAVTSFHIVLNYMCTCKLHCVWFFLLLVLIIWN